MHKREKNIKKDTNKVEHNKNNEKDVSTIEDRIKKNIYYIYATVFVALIVILMALSIYSNKSFTNELDNNRKYNLNSEKFEKTLSENVKNAENNTDSEISAQVKEVSGDNLKDNKQDSKEKKEDLKEKDVSNKDKKEEKDDKKSKKKIYLTFDDGPSEITGKILNILKEHDAKATFFVCYHKGEKNKKLYKRIVDEGHTIGVHSYTHNYKTIYSSEKAFTNDVKKMRNYIKDVTGVETNIYRFPGGSGNKVSKINMKKCIKILKKESMIYFDWNVENGDATGKKISEKQLVNNVVKNVKNKNTPIVLMHDAATKTGTAKTLPKVLKTLKKQGYEFVAINEDTPRIQQRK